MKTATNHADEAKAVAERERAEANDAKAVAERERAEADDKKRLLQGEHAHVEAQILNGPSARFRDLDSTLAAAQYHTLSVVQEWSET
eukprot:SAG11_NODE_7467_length_1139_cov_1.413462_2_plen_87_part_00